MTDSATQQAASRDSAPSAGAAAATTGDPSAAGSWRSVERRRLAAERSRRGVRQFVKFGLVGASGFVVNQGVFVAVKKLTEWGWGVDAESAALNLFGTQFHVRWYMLFSVLAFVVANLWNFMLNRRWTFRTSGKSHWFRELVPFMLVGVGGLIITLAVHWALVNTQSPVSLPVDVFDNSTGLRTRTYWGNFIGVVAALPVNFLLNKVWTFRAVREHRREAGVAEIPAS
ncbi:GtrA family protein [Corynebacterium bovis]|uniref:GtrA family protein n=1 Tax=Corynebacterium bovis TaxID=36808 RepID=UPI003139DF04